MLYAHHVAEALTRPPRRKDSYRMRKWLLFLGVLDPETGKIRYDEQGRRTRKGGYKRTVRAHRPEWRQGDSRYLRWRGDWTKSDWWRILADGRTFDEASHTGREWRRDFRLPRKVFDGLLERVQAVPSLRDKQDGTGNGRGQARSPACLKLMASLYVMAKGCDFRNVQHITHIHENTLRTWFHRLVEEVATGPLFAEWVHPPVTKAELQSVMGVYEKLGFPGAMGSTDGVDCIWERCPAKQTAIHKRDKYPTLGWNVTVSHSRRVMAVAGSFPGTRNDKTRARHDKFIIALKSGNLKLEDGTSVCDAHFTLRTDADGGVRSMKGPYLITDGGYYRAPHFQAPTKYSSDVLTLRWSKRMESVRKDVECTFGIMKKRFRILKVPFNFKKAATCDHVFRACCVLHNMLLTHDELDTIGKSERDWLKADLTADARRIERGHLAMLAQRYAHVVPAKDTEAVPELATDVARWAELRRALMAHFRVEANAGRLLWRRKASELRDAPHRAVGFGAGSDEDAVGQDADEDELDDGYGLGDSDDEADL